VKWLIVVGVLVLIAIGFIFFRLPQPIIEIAPEPVFHIGPIDIINTWFTAWVVIAVIAVVCILGTRKLSLVPSGFQSYFEALVEGFGNIVSGVAGERNGRRFFPVVFALFFYIVISNWSALLPIFNVIGTTDDVYHHVQHEADEHPNDVFADREIVGWVMTRTGIATVVPLFQNVDYIRLIVPENTTNAQALNLLNAELATTLGRPAPGPDDEHGPLHDNETFGFVAPWLRGSNTDINAPLAFALWSAIFVEFWGITALGFFSYGSKFFNFKRLLKGDIVNGIIDVFVGFLELISELSRLISFTFRLFGNIFAGEVLLFMMSFLVPLVLINVFYGLELFVGLIQAFVFAMLTLVFGVMAVSGHGDHEHEEHHAGHPAGGEQERAHA
jgi:F-type H+-transporting ATPase subunit a